MVDFTTVNPSSRRFDIGKNINNKLEIGLVVFSADKSVGTGNLTTFVSDELHANGNYNTLGQSGTFDISVTPDDGFFQVSVTITGSLAGESRQFQAVATQVNATTVKLAQQGGNLSLTLAQDTGRGTLHGPQIDISISWRDVTLYVQRLQS